MNIKLFRNLATVTIFSLSIFLTSCGGSSEPWVDPMGESVKYRNDEVSYADGEVCEEYYQIYLENDEYKRYINGTYFGNETSWTYSGTLFETGTYKRDEEGEKITFHPKKQYNFETKKLEYLGLEKQEPYIGTLTDTELTITWIIKKSFFETVEIPIEYKLVQKKN